jgi:hypothetical protein
VRTREVLNVPLDFLVVLLELDARGELGPHGVEQRRQGFVLDVDAREKCFELFGVDLRKRPERVECEEHESLLLLVEVDVANRHELVPESRELDSQVSVEEALRARVEDDRLDPPDAVERSRERGALGFGVEAPVERVRREDGSCRVAVLDYARLPAGCVLRHVALGASAQGEMARCSHGVWLNGKRSRPPRDARDIQNIRLQVHWRVAHLTIDERRSSSVRAYP